MAGDAKLALVRCGNTDCEQKVHFFPKAGVTVRTERTFRYREPGTDNRTYKVRAGELGQVETYEPSFHEAIVNFPDGRKVWIDIDDLVVD